MSEALAGLVKTHQPGTQGEQTSMRIGTSFSAGIINNSIRSLSANIKPRFALQLQLKRAMLINTTLRQLQGSWTQGWLHDAASVFRTISPKASCEAVPKSSHAAAPETATEVTLSFAPQAFHLGLCGWVTESAARQHLDQRVGVSVPKAWRCT
jgi:hypothetical protein